MARLHTSGFEQNSTVAGNADVYTLAGSPTIISSGQRSGNYALNIASLSSGAIQGILYKWAASTTNGPYFFRTYYKVDTLPTAENRIIALGSASGTVGNTARAYITIDQTGVLRLYTASGPTQIGSASAALNVGGGQYYRIEMKFDNTHGAGAAVLEAQIDGVTFATTSAGTIPGAVFAYSLGGNLNSEAQTTGNWSFDDVAINDDSGSFQNTYPGSGKVIALYPDSAGDNTTWSRGGVDSGANWSQVEEVTPNDATDFVADKTSGDIDDYNIGATGMSGSETINVVHVGQRYNGASASLVASFVLRVKASSGGTVEESAPITANSGTWRFASNADPRVYPLTLYDLPGASTTAWAPSDLATAQIGERISTTNTNNAQITAIWMLVDYTPASNITTPQTIQGQSRITAITSQIVPGKARVQVTTLQTTTGRGRIGIVTLRTVQGLARVAILTTKQAQGLARVTAATLRTVTGKGSINKSTAQTATGKGRIQITTLQTALGRGRILKVVTQAVQGLGRVTIITARTAQGLARITASTPRAIQGLAKITATTLRTTQGKARIQIVTPQTIQGKSRIGFVTPQTVPGKARISGTTPRTATGIANLLQTLSTDYYVINTITVTARTILGRARVQATVPQNVLGKSRIQTTVNQSLTGIARMVAGAQRIITGQARVQATATKNQLGIARITQTVIKVVQGLARITTVVPRTVLGKARVTATTPQAVTGRARITALTNRTVQGIGRVVKTAVRTLSGQARLLNTSPQTIIGKSRVQTTVIKNAFGKAAISHQVQVAIQGLATIFNRGTDFNQTITGRAHICVDTWESPNNPDWENDAAQPAFSQNNQAWQTANSTAWQTAQLPDWFVDC